MEFSFMDWKASFDGQTGRLTALSRAGFPVVSQQAPMLTLTIDGVSTLNNQRQMHNIDLYTVVGERSRLDSFSADGGLLTVSTSLEDGFALTSRYDFGGDYVKLEVDIRYDGDGAHRLRWINWRTEMPHRQGEPFAPGYTFNRGEPFDLHRRFADYRHAELLAHDAFGDHVPAYRPGFLGAYLPEKSECACTWFASEMFPCYTPSWRCESAVVREAQVHCARWMRHGDVQRVGDFYFGAARGSREECIRAFTRSWETYGWDRADDFKALREIRILELHIGEKSGRTLFESYAQAEAALDEIQKLGFNTIEVMPAFPFPSYSVFDLADLQTTYGDEAGLVRFARAVHERGMKLICDMVFHGPLEYDEAGVKKPRSPYLDGHPDWFMRHERGDYARTYTRSFDMGNPDYQAHIGDCMEMMIDRLGADGFRLDAQMWSETPNWDDACPRKPYESVLAGMRMMDGISARIHRKHPNVFFYTEANGPYSAKGHEYRYNYDCHWLYPALAPVVDRRGMSAYTLNYASMATLSWADAAMWLTEMRLTTPAGMAIVFQTDSHDSCEWGGYIGGQYNREAFGEDMHRALYALVNALDGGLMSFYGAAKGSEDFYVWLADKMRDPVMKGECSYTAVTCDDPKTALIQWTNGSARRLFAINLERRTKRIALSDGTRIDLDPCCVRIIDGTND